MLQFYNSGRSKKTAGNIMFYGGMAILATDFLVTAGKEGNYPTVFTIVGVTSLILSIPIKIGYTRKIKTVVKDYNTELSNKDSGFTFESMSIVSNLNGLGVKITF